MSVAQASQNTQTASGSTIGLGAPLLVVCLLAMMVVPLPAFALDVFFTFNIALSLIILLVVIYTHKPLQLAAFPTILLVVTLMRLALNIASTRVVLLDGHNGGAAAGKVIESFGEFVIGGNYAVGLVVFAILVIINFVVVTKGAGRISEVTARFTLDALPGKQMAIDADLNAGIIDQDQARARREEVSSEAGFYGAMDGASKFVRGDAVAGIVILFINVIGGLFIGTLQHGLDLSQAAEFYVLLTIGDGLVAQIPSLVISTAAAVIITRVSSGEDMGSQLTSQLFSDPRPLAITAGILGLVGIVPGMPNFVFLMLAGIVGTYAWRVSERNKASSEQQAKVGSLEPVADAALELKEKENKDLNWEDVAPLDVVSLEVGYALVPLVDTEQGGDMMNRIKGIRKKLTAELGFLVQAVHIHDNLALSPNAYRISLLGVTLGEGELQTSKELAINPGTVYASISGTKTIDPAFGLEAYWIERTQRDTAQAKGYTVVDPSTVVATHLSQLLKNNAYLLLGHDETQRLLDNLTRTAPRLVEGLVPDTVTLSVLTKVLQGLLRDGVPIRDLRTICETVAEFAPRTTDPVQLLAFVRVALGRLIMQQITGPNGELKAVTLDPNLEQLLLNSNSTDSQSAGQLEPGLADRMMRSLQDVLQQQEAQGESLALLVPDQLRSSMAKWLKHNVQGLWVLSYQEVPDDWRIRIVSTVGA